MECGRLSECWAGPQSRPEEDDGEGILMLMLTTKMIRADDEDDQGWRPWWSLPLALAADCEEASKG